MNIKDIEVLIECKRLVERLLKGEYYILDKLEQNGTTDTQIVREKIEMMERALEGKPFQTPERWRRVIGNHVGQ